MLLLPVRPPSFGEGRQERAGKRVGVGERAPPVRRGFLTARGGRGVAAAVAAAAKMAEGLERVRISASELRGILATLAPQAGSRGELRRPAAGPGLPAPPPSPLPPPRPVRSAPSPRPFPNSARGLRRPLGDYESGSQLTWVLGAKPSASFSLRPLAQRGAVVVLLCPNLTPAPEFQS